MPKTHGLLQVFVDRQHHVGSELLGSQAIATTDADDVRLGHGLQGGAHLQEERLTLGALLLGADVHDWEKDMEISDVSVSIDSRSMFYIYDIHLIL